MNKWSRFKFTPNLPLGANGERVTGSKAHIELSKEAAKEGMVLLKNENNVLPLAAGSKVALFGKGTFDYVKGGGGSGDVTVAYIRNLYEGLKLQKEKISIKDAFIIGIAQACAVLPGLSRSGSTIATGLLLGNKKENLAQFSFLMVIPPILGEALLDVIKGIKGEETFGGIETLPLIVGFITAFISGCVACQWMINVVKKGKLIYFGIYCAIVGIATILTSFFN